MVGDAQPTVKHDAKATQNWHAKALETTREGRRDRSAMRDEHNSDSRAFEGPKGLGVSVTNAAKNAKCKSAETRHQTPDTSLRHVSLRPGNKVQVRVKGKLRFGVSSLQRPHTRTEAPPSFQRRPPSSPSSPACSSQLARSHARSPTATVVHPPIHPPFASPGPVPPDGTDRSARLDPS